jgi:hypothetical protein
VSGRTWRLLVVGVVVLAGACSDDDDSADTVAPTPPPTAATATGAPTTAVETTEALTTTSEAPTATTTTTVPPTTESVDDLKAQIAADYVAARERARAITAEPSLRRLRARAARAATGEALDILVQHVRGLVEREERVVPGEPPVQVAIVEKVEIASLDATSATVTACIADNSRVVLPADESPIGSDVFTGDGALVAERLVEPVTLTANGWLPSAARVDVVGSWEGSDSCPDA